MAPSNHGMSYYVYLKLEASILYLQPTPMECRTVLLKYCLPTYYVVDKHGSKTKDVLGTNTFYSYPMIFGRSDLIY